MRKRNILKYIAAGALVIAFSSCKETDSYSNLLKKEEKATNWYLSNQRVSLAIPTYEDIETGENAPFYKLDPDGYVYMQVIDKGDADSRPQSGDLVYFRYNRTDLRTLYKTGTDVSDGNDNDMQYASASFIYDDYTLQSTLKYGRGVQMALSNLGYNSEVNLVLRSYYGFTEDQSKCTPYLINIRYFKAEY